MLALPVDAFCTFVVAVIISFCDKVKYRAGVMLTGGISHTWLDTDAPL